MQTPLRRTFIMTWLLLCAIMPLASALDYPAAMPSFRANVWTTYASSGVDCDAGDGCQSHKYHQMLTNHTLEQSLRVSFDAQSERMRIDIQRGSRTRTLVVHRVPGHGESGKGAYLNTSTIEGSCTSSWKMIWLASGFPSTVADLVYFYGGDDIPSYTQTRLSLYPFPFYGIQLDTFDGTEDAGKGPWPAGSLAGTWESEDNIGNFGGWVGTTKAIFNGTAAGLPLYTEVGDSQSDPGGRPDSPVGNIFATATYSNHTLGAGGEEEYRVPRACWA